MTSLGDTVNAKDKQSVFKIILSIGSLSYGLQVATPYT